MKRSMMIKLVKIIIVFLLIFDLSFNIAPIFSTGKIMFVILTIYFFIKKKGVLKISKKEIPIFLTYMLIFSHILVVYVYNDMVESLTISRFFFYIVYSVILSLLFYELFNDKEEFLNVFVIAVFIQSIFVIISWYSVEFRIIVDQLLVQTGNISLLSSTRPPGLMNSAGAKASVILGLGATFTLFLINNTNSKKKLVLYSLILMINISSTFIVGRTGLLLFIFLSLAVIICNSKDWIFSNRILILSLVTILVLGTVVYFIPNDFIENILRKFEWVTSEFENGLFQSETVQVLQTHTVRKLDIDTLYGTSQTRLLGGEHDSGYIQNYHSIGLLYSVMFYATVFVHLLILIKDDLNDSFTKENLIFIIMVILGLFVVEVKEPFVFSYIYPLVIFTLLRLPQKKSQRIT